MPKTKEFAFRGPHSEMDYRCAHYKRMSAAERCLPSEFESGIQPRTNSSQAETRARNRPKSLFLCTDPFMGGGGICPVLLAQNLPGKCPQPDAEVETTAVGHRIGEPSVLHHRVRHRPVKRHVAFLQKRSPERGYPRAGTADAISGPKADEAGAAVVVMVCLKSTSRQDSNAPKTPVR